MSSFLIVLTGCPYDSLYSIDETPLENIDETLIGRWEGFLKTPSSDNQYDVKPVILLFEKNADKEYQFYITGYMGNLKQQKIVLNDTIKGSCFLSFIAGKQFINSFINGRYYIAELQKEKQHINIKFLSEKFTAKFIRSSQDLRNALDFHLRTRASASYDDGIEFTHLKREK